MSSEASCHVFLVSFPGQGHINPTLRLAKKLASNGLFVTLSSTHHAGQILKKAGSITDKPSPVGNGFISFEFFEDGCPGDDDLRRIGLSVYFRQLEQFGKPSLARILTKHNVENRPVSCLIGNPFLPWVCDLAHETGIPCAVLWIQSCANFSIYYNYFHKSVPFPSESEPNLDVHLPSLPPLKHDEIPTFLHPSNDGDGFQKIAKSIVDQFRNLSIPFCVLVDSFQELESDIINYISTNICQIKPIGPLFKVPKLSDNDDDNNRNALVSLDFIKPEDCFEWLNSKPPRSVVYVSFGSAIHLKQDQVNEIAHGLYNSGFPFLWAMKPLPPSMNQTGNETQILLDELLEKAGNRAKMVQWSSQEKVLSHPSVACFVTHCGWNSSVESVSSGIPMVVFPQMGDQVTNAKFLVDVFNVGLRLSRGLSENRLILRVEIEKCIEEAMVGVKANEIRENALNWKSKADKAVDEGGSSEKNFQEFLDEIKKRSASANKTIAICSKSYPNQS